MPDQIINSTRSNFSKDYIYLLRFIIIMQLILLLGLMFLLFEQFTSEPEPVYFPLKKGDQLIDNVPLEQPLLTDAELLNWVTEAMIVSFSFNYHNYNKIGEKIDEYFDSFGVESYLKIINENKDIQKVVTQKLILSGRPTAAPRIIKDGIVNGRYAWEVEMPFILRFNNQVSNLSNVLKLNILIVRVTEQVSPLGVKIVKIEIV